MIHTAENAVIESTHLGREDHGIFTCYLNLKFSSLGQSFGGYGFDRYDKEKKCRVDAGYGIEFIARLLTVIGAESWEKLPGKLVRIRRSNSVQITAIGNILEDNWFIADEFLAALKTEGRIK